MSSKISKGQANGTIILVAKKMGYDVDFQYNELAIMLYQGDSIEPIYMGSLDAEAMRLHNLIARDKRTDEANGLASEMLEEVKKLKARLNFI